MCSHFNSTEIYAGISVIYRSIISRIICHLWLHMPWKRLLRRLIFVGQLWIIFAQRFAFVLSDVNCVGEGLDTFYLVKGVFADSFNTLTMWKPLIIFQLCIIFIQNIRIIMTVFHIIQHSFRLMMDILFILHFLQTRVHSIQQIFLLFCIFWNFIFVIK